MNQGIIKLDRVGRILYANPYFASRYIRNSHGTLTLDHSFGDGGYVWFRNSGFWS